MNKGNRVLDFFNREHVAGVPASKSKLWRDYPGLIPSQEMVDALNEAVEAKGLGKGIIDAQADFKSLCLKLDKNDQGHILKSLVVIASSISNKKIPYKKRHAEDVIKDVFSSIENFCIENQRMMHNAAKLMQFQLDIDRFLKSSNRDDQDLKEIVGRFKKMQAINGVGTSYGDLRWIKNSPDKPAFVGNLKDYMTERSKELVVTNVDIGKVLDRSDKVSFNLAKPLRRLISKPNLYIGVMLVSAIAVFGVLSVLSAGILPALAAPAVSFVVSCAIGGAGGYKIANYISDKKDEKSVISKSTDVMSSQKSQNTRSKQTKVQHIVRRGHVKRLERQRGTHAERNVRQN